MCLLFFYLFCSYQLWTADEQRRLEELLIEYPPEEVESRRFQKIAEALGNRTRMQVSSRVQKYFLKLMKAGLPVPGRAPRLSSETQKKVDINALTFSFCFVSFVATERLLWCFICFQGAHSRQRSNHFLTRPSTFFPQHQDLPVYMPECDDEDLPDISDCQLTLKTEAINDSLCEEQRKLQLLQKVKREKESGNMHNGIHPGFKVTIFCEYSFNVFLLLFLFLTLVCFYFPV